MSDKRLNKIVETLRSERIKQGIPQSVIAKDLGVISEQVSHYETGRSQLPLRKMLKWADILGLEVKLTNPKSNK